MKCITLSHPKDLLKFPLRLRYLFLELQVIHYAAPEFTHQYFVDQTFSPTNVLPHSHHIDLWRNGIIHILLMENF